MKPAFGTPKYSVPLKGTSASLAEVETRLRRVSGIATIIIKSNQKENPYTKSWVKWLNLECNKIWNFNIVAMACELNKCWRESTISPTARWLPLPRQTHEIFSEISEMFSHIPNNTNRYYCILPVDVSDKVWCQTWICWSITSASASLRE